MSRLLKLGRFGQVYVAVRRGEHSPLEITPIGREGRERLFTFRSLEVIASPPEPSRRWGIV